MIAKFRLNSLFFLTLILACCIPSPTADDNSQLNAIPEALVNGTRTCMPRQVDVTLSNDRQVTLMVDYQDMIGSGKSGDVFSVKTSGDESINANNYVVKIINDQKPSTIDAYDDAVQEYELFRLFPDHVVETYFVDYGHYYTGELYVKASILVKKRIHGGTLDEVLKGFPEGRASLGFVSGKMDKLKQFKKQLANRMAAVANEKGQFMADMHAENVMWNSSKWQVVDGYLITGRSDYTKYLVNSKEAHLAEKLASYPLGEIPSEFFEAVLNLELTQPYIRKFPWLINY